jgi:hypothetical protein
VPRPVSSQVLTFAWRRVLLTRWAGAPVRSTPVAEALVRVLGFVEKSSLPNCGRCSDASRRRERADAGLHLTTGFRLRALRALRPNRPRAGRSL